MNSPDFKRTNDAPKKKKRTIKYFLIEPFKQIKLGLYVIIISLGFTCLAGLMIFQALQEQYQQVMEIFSVVDPSKQWSLLLNNVFLSNVVKLSVLFGGYLILLFGVIISKTHKVYGPLVGVERFLDYMVQGNYWARVRVRKGDDLKNLAVKLNLLAETLQNQYGAPDRRGQPQIIIDGDQAFIEEEEFVEKNAS